MINRGTFAMLALGAIGLMGGLLGGCAATMPSLEGRTASSALADTSGTRLGRALATEAAAHPGKSGIHALANPRDAFAARAVLAAVADKSLDVQYYIWHGDTAGYLLFEALWRAAERGVHVRLLLDDNNTAGMDPTLAALDAHPNLELRLYNPFVQRGARALGYLTDFARLNRRMHNKSFTADNQVAVVGGRNIGDEYFGVGSGVLFADLDVVAVGPAVSEISKQFDLYWNSASAYPAAGLLGAPGTQSAAELQARFAAARADPQSVAYLEAVRTTPVVRDLLARTLSFEWARAQLVHDDPAKTLDTAKRVDVLLFPNLVRAIGQPQKSLDLVSPYFVPGEAGTAALAALAGRGVTVRILTNSLAASDVSAVHAGYSKRRVELLRAGVRLYELKPTAGQELPDSRAGMGSSSASGLHAKTFAVDGERIFVGSFNFDPRSALLNTEMGLVIDSPVLARGLAEGFDTDVHWVAYEVRLASDGRSLQWVERSAAGEKVFDTEPETSAMRRLGVGVMSVLPIDWLL
ncbi:MAG TPA: phospholipase D family protein [Rubrivivax sp.]|nr:phospholipase D family protein [Rubrivivax sp.]